MSQQSTDFAKGFPRLCETRGPRAVGEPRLRGLTLDRSEPLDVHFLPWTLRINPWPCVGHRGAVKIVN